MPATVQTLPQSPSLTSETSSQPQTSPPQPIKTPEPLPQKPQSSYRLVWVVLGFIFIVSISAAAYLKFSPPKPGTDQLNQVIPPPPSSTLAPTLTIRSIPVVSQLGTLYLTNYGDIFLLDEATSQLNQLTQNQQISNLVVDSNNDRIYYLSQGDIYQADLQLANPQQITHTEGQVEQFELSPDHHYLLYYHIDSYTACCGNQEPTMPVTSLYLIDSNGTGQFKVQYPPREKDPNQYYYEQAGLEAWYPDSLHLLLRGHGILDTDNNFWEIDITINSIKKFDRYGDYRLGSMPDIYFSPRGDLFAYTPNYQSLWLADIDGSEKKVISNRDLSSWITWSPDGTKIAGQAYPERNLNNFGESLLVLDIQGNVIYELPTQSKDEGFRVDSWSPDSRFLLAYHYYPAEQPAGDYPPGSIVIADTAEITFIELNPRNEESGQDVQYSGAVIAPSNRIYFKKVYKKSDSELWYYDLSSHQINKLSPVDPQAIITY